MNKIEQAYIDKFGVCPSIEKEIALHSQKDMIEFASLFVAPDAGSLPRSRYSLDDMYRAMNWAISERERAVETIPMLSIEDPDFKNKFIKGMRDAGVKIESFIQSLNNSSTPLPPIGLDKEDIPRLAKHILSENHCNYDERSMNAMKEMYEQGLLNANGNSLDKEELLRWIEEKRASAYESSDSDGYDEYQAVDADELKKFILSLSASQNETKNK